MKLVDTTCTKLLVEVKRGFRSHCYGRLAYRNTVLVQLAQEILQENIKAQQYAAAVLWRSIRISQTLRNGDQPTHKFRHVPMLSKFSGHIQQLTAPVAAAQSYLHLQPIFSSIQERESRTAALEAQLLQDPLASKGQESDLGVAVEQEMPVAAAGTVRGFQHIGSQRYDKALASIARNIAMQKEQHQLAGHSQQLAVMWPLQASPTPEQQLFAAAHAARSLSGLQQRQDRQMLQRVTTLNLQVDWRLASSHRANDREASFWQGVNISPSQAVTQQVSRELQLRLKAGISAMAASPNTDKLAIGSQGTVIVLFLSVKGFAACLEGRSAEPARLTPVTGVIRISPPSHIHSFTLAFHGATVCHHKHWATEESASGATASFVCRLDMGRHKSAVGQHICQSCLCLGGCAQYC